jgi:hypothetical protein
MGSSDNLDRKKLDRFADVLKSVKDATSVVPKTLEEYQKFVKAAQSVAIMPSTSKTLRATHSPAGQVGTDIPAEKTFLFFSR